MNFAHRSFLSHFGLLTAFLVGALLSGGPKARAGDVSGTITQDTTFAGTDTTTVTGDLSVQAGVVLTIEAGAVVKVNGGYQITVNGSLDANGTSSDQILFTSGQSSPSPGDWKGLKFTGDVYPSPVLEHVQVEYASNGILANGVTETATLKLQPVTIRNVGQDGIQVRSAVAEISGGTVEDVGNRGVLVRRGADVTIDNLTASQSGDRVQSGDGIDVRSGSTLQLTGSEIRRFGIGLDISDENRNGGESPETVTATGNVFSENRTGIGVRPGQRDFAPKESYPSLEVRRNVIAGNLDWAVQVREGKNARRTELDFTRNWWGTTDGVAIAGRIRDQSDDGGSAFVEFLPMLDGEPGSGPSETRTGPNGQTFWNGRIETDQTWTSGSQPTLVGETIFASAGLTIESGTRVEVVDDALVVKGRSLAATGTSSQPIVFTSEADNPSPGDWEGVVLDGAQTDRLKQWRVRYANRGLSIKNIQPSMALPVESVEVDSVRQTGVFLEKAKVSGSGWSVENAREGVVVRNSSVATTLSSPTVRNIGQDGIQVRSAVAEISGGTVEDVGNRGVLVRRGADVTIDNLTASQSGDRVQSGDGIDVRSGSTLQLTGSEIRRFGIGLDISDENRNGGESPETVTATGNVFSENRTGIGVRPGQRDFAPKESYPSLEVRRNVIAGNLDWAVQVREGKNARRTELDFTRNWWGTTDGVAIAGRIRDQSDDGGSAFVEFLPMLDGEPGSGPSETRTGPNGQTFWNGRIGGSVSWRDSESPHVVVGKVILNEAGSLTIEGGSTVQFLKNGLQARGSLVAQGTEDARIQIGLLEDSPVNQWPGLTLESPSARTSRLLYTTIRQAQTGIQIQSIPDIGSKSYPKLRGAIVKETGTAVSVTGSRVDIQQTRIVNFDTEGVRVSGSDAIVEVFDRSTVAQDGRRTRSGTCIAVRNQATVTVRTSVIAACERGLNVHSNGSSVPQVELSSNVLTRHSAGVRIDPNRSGDPYPDVTVMSNDILGNENLNVRLEPGKNPTETTLDFTQNWWGTTDSTSIEETIRDSSDSDNLAAVNFSNKLTEENGQYGLADINSDGRTDGFDLSALAAAFGSRSGEEDYNPDANLNTDDRIDGFDLSLLGTRFGQLGATDLKRSLRGGRLLAAGGAGPVRYVDRPDSVMRREATQLRVTASRGPFAPGDTLTYRFRVENTPSLFAVSAGLQFDQDDMEYARGRIGGFLSEEGDVPVFGLTEAEGGGGHIGLTRTRSHRYDSPSGSGRLATLSFVAQSRLEEAPSLTLSDVGLLAPDGRTTYKTGLKGRATPPDRREKDPPERFALKGNYPNPFSGSTTLSFSLPERSDVRIVVYDALGRQVTTLIDQRINAGRHTIRFNAQNLASGVYFSRMKAGGQVETVRMTVIK